jgi:hypothetical protein
MYQNNQFDFAELSPYTCKLRQEFLRVEDGYISYGQFNTFPVRWFNLEHRPIFHSTQRGIQPPTAFRRFTTILISTNEEYSFLDQFKNVDDGFASGVFAMQPDGEVVEVPDDRLATAPCEWDIAYSGMRQRGRKIGKLNQHMVNVCTLRGVVLVVMTNGRRGECRVMGFYEGIGANMEGPGDHPHKFFLRRIPYYGKVTKEMKNKQKTT